jgi:hypothetical protein
MIATLDALNSLLNVDSPAKFFVVIALIVSAAVVFVAIVVLLSTLSTHNAELQFKRDLVERGLSVDETERIVSAKPAGKVPLSCRKPTEASASTSRV